MRTPAARAACSTVWPGDAAAVTSGAAKPIGIAASAGTTSSSAGAYGAGIGSTAGAAKLSW